jgi:iron(III) transport system ATP-binding protein
MDEPFSGLDPRLRERIREETLAILHEPRATCIVVTHDAKEGHAHGRPRGAVAPGTRDPIGPHFRPLLRTQKYFAARTFST